MLFLLTILPGRAQILDLNRNGLSDLWETLYDASTFAPDFDSDGDGVPNRLEAMAGTDPRDARSVSKISEYGLTTNGVQPTFHVILSGALGKRYQLQSRDRGTAGPAGNWSPEGSQVARTNSTVRFAVVADRQARFFRTSVGDVDSDGDGLNDWEEYQLGLDPLSALSNGESDASGTRMNDYRFVTNRLASETLASLLEGALASRPNFQGPVCQIASRGAFTMAGQGPPSGTGLTAHYHTNASANYTNVANFHPANLFLTTNDAVVDFLWGPLMTPNLSDGLYSVRWTGQVQPQYSETYFFETRTDDGVKLWVNDQLLIDHWQVQGITSWTNSITLVAEVRYNVRMEYFNRNGTARARLSWFSASQPRQAIPAARLYPASGGYAPGSVTSPLIAHGFVGEPFQYVITGANSPLAYSAANVPAGLAFNPTNGVISGIPTLAGSFEVSLAVSNAVGVGVASLRLEVIDTGRSVVREVWLGAPGATVADIPVHLAATQTNALGNLEGVTNFGDNYGERVRGYLIAPVTGQYYFWIAGNSAAELWISNDAEPANKVRRAYVSSPRNVNPRQWVLHPKQKSGWLALEAGQRYYLEVLHKAGKGAIDHWSVGWLQDATGTNTVPAGVVPGYVLAPYLPTPPASIPGTLYSANMVAQPGALSAGVGSATLRLSADESQAVLRFSQAGLSAPVTGKHIHADTYLGKNGQGQIVFDIDTATPALDGSYVWNIGPSGPLTAADLVEIIRQGKAYINLHTVNYPAGEINGHFGLAAGTASFTPPPPPPAWAKDHSSSNAAARFLQQATFGASPAEIRAVRSGGYEAWIDKQFGLRPSGHLTNVLTMAAADPNSGYSGSQTFNTWWKHSVTAPDQLRQRVAFALSQIMVVSESGPLQDNPRALSSYYDTLLKHAFGNFRELLEAVTLSPGMGIYLDMRRNDKGSLVLGTHPNENYAREILQLFSVGVNRMWPDGTLVINSAGDLVPTYNQEVIIGYAHTFTGWNYGQPTQPNRRLPVNWNPAADYTNAMVLVPTHHELGTKRLLGNVLLPAAWGTQADPASTNCDTYCAQDLRHALDSIFENANVGPFICRQLIQRLVTSHPSRDYVYRVVQKFNDNGQGVRGDMRAVIKGILLDYEARGTNVILTPTQGKQREPLLRATALARALPAPPPLKASYKQSGGPTVTISSATPHRLNTGDDVSLTFPAQAGPASGIYHNVVVTDSKSFTISPAGIAFGTYGQAGNTLTVTNAGHGLAPGQEIYLTIVSGGASSAIRTVASVISSSVFTLSATSPASRAGNGSFSKWTGTGYLQAGTNLTFITSAPHGLSAGQRVFVDFAGNGGSTNGSYRVARVLTSTRFTVISGTSANRSGADAIVFPLIAAPVNRSGAVTVRYGTWNLGYTDRGFSSGLSQTPLNAPTVFNYFFPDYKFQGILASAGLTTPEFQLTSDTTTVLQMNFLSGGIFSSSGNTNGLSSFSSGNGSIMLDIGPWMSPANTSNAGIPGLVDRLNTLLCSGQLSTAARNIIVNYVADTSRFPLATPAPTHTQMRDRVRAVLHLITAAPEFIVQR